MSTDWIPIAVAIFAVRFFAVEALLEKAHRKGDIAALSPPILLRILFVVMPLTFIYGAWRCLRPEFGA